MFGTVAALREAVAAHAAGTDPAVLEPVDAARSVSEWGAIENIAAVMKARAAARVAATSAWRASGAPSAADWLARTTGVTAARARDQLTAAERLEALEAVADAACRGELSVDQTAAIADAATADPGAEATLLGAARRESLGELRQRCQRTKAAADPDPEATGQRLHAARSFRSWTSADGAGHLHASGPPELVARVHTAMRPIIEEQFAAARAEGRREHPEAYAFDALIELADRATTPDTTTTTTARRRTRYRAVLRVDWDALVRGGLEPGETCEIAGLGPVPVSTARSLLGDSTLHLVLTKGADVSNVTYLGRGPNAAQRIALLWQMPACTRLGCNRTARLQIDHRHPYADCQVTELHNLDPLCDHDHRLKTEHDWALIEGTGRRPLVPPEHPDHPRQRQPTREPALTGAAS